MAVCVLKKNILRPGAGSTTQTSLTHSLSVSDISVVGVCGYHCGKHIKLHKKGLVLRGVARKLVVSTREEPSIKHTALSSLYM